MLNKLKEKKGTVYAVLAVVLLAVILSALVFGSAKMSIPDVIRALFGMGEKRYVLIIRNVRLPRILAGLLAGIGLSVSGILLQNVTQNKLAGPNIIGVNAGAGLMVILMMSFFPTAVYALPTAAFLGAFLTTLFIIFLANRLGSTRITVILAGMALTTIFSAAISFFCLLDADIASSYVSFSVGSIAQVSAKELLIPAVMIFAAFLISLILSSQLDILSLGDSLASSLGIRVRLLRGICLTASSLAAAAVVSYAGLLGFVGLVVPHIARNLAGEKARDSLLCGILVGPIFVISGDMIGRTLFAPTEIPVGIMMALIGSPFFLYLLFRRRQYD